MAFWQALKLLFGENWCLFTRHFHKHELIQQQSRVSDICGPVFKAIGQAVIRICKL